MHRFIATLTFLHVLLIAGVQNVSGEPNHLYFGTYNGGLRIFSIDTGEVSFVFGGTSYINGIAGDPNRGKLYWANYNGTIYRGNLDGTDVEIVMDDLAVAFDVYSIEGLAVDWITGNLYVACRAPFNHVILCDTSGSTLSCAAVVSKLIGYPTDLALDPENGFSLIYWSHYIGGYIWRAGMDGSNPIRLVDGGSLSARSVTLDSVGSRLYWTSNDSDTIQYSDLDGQNVTTLIKLPYNSGPRSVTLLNGRLYWGNFFSRKIQSALLNGEDIQTVHNSTELITGLAAIELPRASVRVNHCAGNICPGICVLTMDSYRCLS